MNELDKLRKDLEKDPKNEDLQSAYEIALSRAGKQEELQEYFTFRFLCDKKWDDLSRVQEKNGNLAFLEKGVRFCEGCQKQVHFAPDQKTFKNFTKKGYCVAVIGEKMEEVFSQLTQQYAGEPKENKIPSCIVYSRKDPTKEREQMIMGMPARDYSEYDDRDFA